MQGMRDLLRGSLKRSLRDLSDEDRLTAAWPVACGTALAARGEVQELDTDGTLHVRVVAPEWMQLFISMRGALANDLSKISGVTVREIHFSQKANTRALPAADGVKTSRAPGEKH